mmetsp:Transcript_5527/g.34196  ORF Transcript_5527/g.34196 Transcript_5527/m.34196 type:complete len:230 (-) Transcript_5527:35-724(-)
MRHGFRLHGGTGVSSLLHRTLRLVRVLLRLCMRRGLCCNLVALVLLQHSGGSTGRLHGWHLVRGRSHGCLHGNGGPLLHVVRGCVVGVSRLLQLLLLLLWLQVRRRHRPGLWRQVRRGVSLCSRYVSISIRFRILVLRERRRLCLDGSFEGTLRWELDVSGSRDTRRILDPHRGFVDAILVGPHALRHDVVGPNPTTRKPRTFSMDLPPPPSLGVLQDATHPPPLHQPS